MTAPTWPTLAGAVLASLGTAVFPAALLALVRSVAPFTYSVAFGYCGATIPIDLHDDFPEDKRAVFVSRYQAGPYLLDPFYQAAMRPVEPGLYRLRDLAPDRFYQGEYFRTYYGHTGLSEEIGYFAGLPEGGMVVLSLMRAERPFSPREFRALDALSPFVLAAAGKHWAGIADQSRDDMRATGVKASESRTAPVFERFGKGILTPRERKVAELTLKGHSAESVGDLLGISPGTARVHRRNIYTKLRINSQGELFARFVDLLIIEE